MPQMSPMGWLWLIMFMYLMIMFFLSKFSYLGMKLLSHKIMYKLNMKYKW